jgi:hypothetical protein
MQMATRDGLVSAPTDASRCTIVVVHGAPSLLAHTLKEEWSHCTAADAYCKLAKPDVQVTNLRDKQIQLHKIQQLDHMVRMLPAEKLPARDLDEARTRPTERDPLQRAYRLSDPNPAPCPPVLSVPETEGVGVPTAAGLRQKRAQRPRRRARLPRSGGQRSCMWSSSAKTPRLSRWSSS